MATKSQMRLEIEEIPIAAERLLSSGSIAANKVGKQLREANPLFVATIARGSSDHASGFLKYAIELELGLPVASLGPSVASVYGRQMQMGRSATFAVSQSGKSPDIVSMAENARRGGSFVSAITNNPSSPLALSAEASIDLLAGPELSVAATKSFVNSTVAGMLILAAWTGNATLKTAIDALPAALGQAITCDWSPLLHALEGHSSRGHLFQTTTKDCPRAFADWSLDK